MLNYSRQYPMRGDAMSTNFAMLFRSYDQAFTDAARAAGEEARAKAGAAGLSVTYEQDGQLVEVAADGTETIVKALDPVRTPEPKPAAA